MPEAQLEIPMEQDNLSTVTHLLDKAAKLEAEALEVAGKLKALEDERNNIVTKMLPDIFAKLGMTEIRLRDGSIVKMVSNYHAKIPKAKEAAAYEWLRSHNMGSIIKQGLDVSAEHREALIAASVPFTLEESVHAMTLKALVREQIEAGNDFPRDLFGVFVEDSVIRKGP